MSTEGRATSEVVIVERQGQGQRATSEAVIVERQGAGQRASEVLVVVELVALAAYATAVMVLVELAPTYRPKAHYEYNGVDLAPYLTAMNLSNMPRELGNGTLGSTGMDALAGISEFEASLTGNWTPEVDALLAKDARRKAWRTGRAYYEDGAKAVSYTWANATQVREWQVTAQANGKIEFSATLRHNGMGVRMVSEV